MQKQPLALRLPLDQICLIEASAGTGKTYTMAQIYLRLILGIGITPLSVDKILVVTYTKAATQELKKRIRERILETEVLFRHYYQNIDRQLENDDYLLMLYQKLDDIPAALMRLKIAAQDMDLAGIFTIHSFCQKMLFQFSFDSGVRFDIELNPNEKPLLRQLSEEVWRELYYPLNSEQSKIIYKELGSPYKVLDNIYGFISAEIPETVENIPLLPQDYFVQKDVFIQEIKSFWAQNQQRIYELIDQDIQSKQRKLNGRSFTQKNFQRWFDAVCAWCHSGIIAPLPSEFEKFTQKHLIEKKNDKSDEILYDECFVQCENYYQRYQQQENHLKAILSYQFLIALRNKREIYKQTHNQTAFDDLLTLLHHALNAEQGEVLANKIRQSYQFAMIDEFQDTDQIQYEIFRQIFMQNNQSGFMMIGDPKQSIYKFRGADIFSYLKAKKEATVCETLEKNWRSLPAVVENTNKLFSFDAANPISSFLYQDIPFNQVGYKATDNRLVGGKSFSFTLLEEYKNEKLIAEQCAAQIYRQLKQSASGEFYVEINEKCRSYEQAEAKLAELIEQEKAEKRAIFTDYRILENEDSDKPFMVYGKKAFLPADITILVSNINQANAIKQALQKYAIPSVYLSEKHSVFSSAEATELLWLLKACLHTYRYSDVLRCLGSLLWGKTAEELLKLKNNDGIEWEAEINKLVNFRRIWQKQGILPMLHTIFIQENIFANLQTMDNSARRMTNLLHLSELLQQAANQLENEQALLHWFAQQIRHQDIESSDEYLLRLESEKNLITIVTIHKSKGLEYPIVWLPFIGKESREISHKKLHQFYSENGKKQWNISENSDIKDIEYRLTKEIYAEELRLLYVAVTRAASQVNFILPSIFNNDGWNPLFYLFSQGQIELNNPQKIEINNADYLNKAFPDSDIYSNIEIEENSAEIMHYFTPNIPNVQAKSFVRKIPKHLQQLSSFSHLQNIHQKRQNFQNELLSESEKDYDLSTALIIETENNEEHIPSPFTFPRSAKVGNLLHAILEHLDFTQPFRKEAADELCAKLDLDEAWSNVIMQWFEHILATPIAENLWRLNCIPPNKRLNEWQFYLRLRNPEALPQLNQLMQKHCYLVQKYHLPELNLIQLEGFIKGFVDCIIEFEGKYYIVDYKSNFLGFSEQDYHIENIEEAMCKQRYDLQFTLYTLALHRYLTFRLGEDYDYDTHFGGVAYLFLRGMNGNSGSGVYFEKPSCEFIEKLDQLFG